MSKPHCRPLTLVLANDFDVRIHGSHLAACSVISPIKEEKPPPEIDLGSSGTKRVSLLPRTGALKEGGPVSVGQCWPITSPLCALCLCVKGKGVLPMFYGCLMTLPQAFLSCVFPPFFLLDLGNRCLYPYFFFFFLRCSHVNWFCHSFL